MFEKYLFILSITAGHGKNVPSPDRIRSVFEKMGQLSRLQIIETSYVGHPMDAAKEFAKEYGERGIVYACGGDGTINEVARGVYGSWCYMGALPCGTGNDFCRHLYGEQTVEDLLMKTLEPTKGTCDLMKIGDLLSVNVTSFGYDSMVLLNVQKLLKRFPKLGRWAYLAGVFVSLFSERNFSLSYELEDEKGEIHKGDGKFTLGAIANGSYYGGGFHTAPYADIGDGILDILLVCQLGFFEFLSLIPKYRKGEHLSNPKVLTWKAVRGKITAKKNEIIANYDGELTSFKELVFEVLPKAVFFAYL